MEELPLTKAHLESLANADLLKLADSFGIDITQNQDRVFLIEELLEVSSPDGDEPNDTPEEEMADLVFVESAPLPRYYNVTFIEVMIRDPFWAFVFWEIKASEKEQLEKAQDFNGYCLRVKLLNGFFKADAATDRQGLEEMLSVQVSPTDTAWYLGFAPNSENETLGPDENQLKTGQNQNKTDQNQYIVELCASIGEVETVLAVSTPIRMPGLPELPKRAGEQDRELGENELVRLSGYGDFHVLRRNERPLRAKKDIRSE
ncbi:MAG: DUF4912 domain-containing protein [Treponema sp.]|jgi:hypothetical protein|nr:DUF4912 domain-containing protein [Treponema sp.]